MLFLVYSQSCAILTAVNYRTFHHLKRKNINSHSLFFVDGFFYLMSYFKGSSVLQHPYCISAAFFLCQIIFWFTVMPHFIYLLNSKWTFGCFHSLAILNKDVMNLHIQVLCGHLFPHKYIVGIYLVYTQQQNCWVIW